jgi:hypothetical protein
MADDINLGHMILDVRGSGTIRTQVTHVGQYISNTMSVKGYTLALGRSPPVESCGSEVQSNSAANGNGFVCFYLEMSSDV